MLLVEVLLVYIIWRFRARPNQPRPRQIHGNTKLEILWTTIPAIIIVIISVPTILTIFDIQKRAPEDALQIEVIGHQWWWEFRYPEQGIVAGNQFFVPVGRPVELRLRSADVIHSFWIPRIGGKRDVNPPPAVTGDRALHTNQILFTADEEGAFTGQCAEFCGESHAIMRMVAHAVSPEAFDAWVAQMRGGADGPGVTPLAGAGAATATATADTAAAAAPASPPAPLQAAAIPAPTGMPPQRPAIPAMMQPGAKTDAELGRDIFLTKACVACHAIAGTPAAGAIGPTLTRYGARPWVGAGAARNTLDNVQQWIRDPESLKPGVLMPGAQTPGGGMPPTNLTDEEIRLIATYLMSLK
jgi:cytochrome c oxidase subunit 2